MAFLPIIIDSERDIRDLLQLFENVTGIRFFTQHMCQLHCSPVR